MIYTYDIIPPEMEPEARAELINLVDTLNSVLAERDNYKRRAEALEKATNGFCFSCGNKNCNVAGQYHRQLCHCSAYAFDEARFSTGGDCE